MVGSGSSASGAVDWLLERLWAPILAVTAADGGRANGLISSTVVNASLLREAPRIVVQLAKANLTHELVLGSGALAVHLLPATELGLVRQLGFHSGRDCDKLAGVPMHPGITNSPVLEDALAYLEARVARTLEGDEITVVLADVVAGELLREGEPLTIDHLRERMPSRWLDEWDARRRVEIGEARRLRGER